MSLPLASVALIKRLSVLWCFKAGMASSSAPPRELNPPDFEATPLSGASFYQHNGWRSRCWNSVDGTSFPRFIHGHRSLGSNTCEDVRRIIVETQSDDLLPICGSPSNKDATATVQRGMDGDSRIAILAPNRPDDITATIRYCRRGSS